MTNDDRVVVAGGYPGAELLPVCRFKVLLRGHEHIRGRVQPQKLACPLLREVVRHGEHGLAAQAEAFGLHSRRSHREGFPGPDLVCQKRVPAVEDAGNGVSLVLAQLYLRVHAWERQVRAVVLTRSCAVEQLVILGDKRLAALRVFPQPVAEGVLDDLLLLLGEGCLLDVEHPALGAVCVLDLVVDAHVAEVQGVFEYLVGVHARGAVGAESVDVGCTDSALALDAPLGSVGRVVHAHAARGPVCGLEGLDHELLYVARLYPGRAEADSYLARGQLPRLRGAQCLYINIKGRGCFCRCLFCHHLCLTELFPHVAGEIFVGGRVTFLAWDAEDDAGKLHGDLNFVFAAEPGHILHVHAAQLIERDGQRLRCRLGVLRRAVRLDGAAREHICFALKFAVLVENFERAEEVIRAVVRKRALVLTV